MDMLTRSAGYLAMAGGALLAVLAGVIAYDPNTDAWYWFFLVVALLGAAVFGLERATRAATRGLGRASAWLSGTGALALLAVFAYAVATDRLTPTSEPTSDPLAPFWTVTAIAWFLGNLGFGLAIVRGKSPSVIGGWLVLAGAVVGLGFTAVLGENVPSAVTLLFGLFGIGWVLVGYSGARLPARA